MRRKRRASPSARCRARRSSRGRSRFPREARRGRRRRSGCSSGRRRTRACRRACRSRRVDVQAAARVVDPEQAARDDRARPAGAVAPRLRQPPVAEAPGRGAAVVRSEEPRDARAMPDRGRREEVGAGRRRDDLQLAAAMRRRAAHPLDRQHSDLPVLAALRDVARARARPARWSRGRRRPRSAPRCSSACSCRRARSHPAREAEHRVAPVGLAVPGRVACRDEQLSVRRVDDCAGATPDRGVARAAARRVDQSRCRLEQSEFHTCRSAPPRADDRDVALVGRRVADVAAGRRDHVPVREVERRRDLLARRQLRDRHAPRAVAVRDRRACRCCRRARPRRSTAGSGSATGVAVVICAEPAHDE